jgi:serine/threonine protein kinase
VKIVDFGLSVLAGDDFVSTENSGTSVYSAPEVLLSQPQTPKADIWSLGCIVYKMLTGTLPFKSIKRDDLIKEHESSDYNKQSLESLNLTQ